MVGQAPPRPTRVELPRKASRSAAVGGCPMRSGGGPGMLRRVSRRTSTVALLDRPYGGAVLRPVGVGDRLGARLHGAALDRALARGAVPESGVALTLHARRLIGRRMRRRLARTLQGIVAMTRRPPVPPARPPGAQVAGAGADLLALAERLQRPDPVDARGVALVRMLLRDGGGPLHLNRGADWLAAAAHAAAAALEP